MWRSRIAMFLSGCEKEVGDEKTKKNSLRAGTGSQVPSHRSTSKRMETDLGPNPLPLASCRDT